MSKRPAHRIIYNFQRAILLVCYLGTAIALSLPLIRLMQILSPNHLYPLLAVMLLYLVAVVVLGAYIYYISFIPFNLAAAFDPIKNDVADGSIRKPETLGRRICEFTCRFFDFSFLDISHCILHLRERDPISHQSVPELEKLLKELRLEESAQQLDTVIRAGKIQVERRHYHLYVLPIWFREHWLGYLALFTERRIGRFYRQFLMEYEDSYLDDLLMLMLNRGGTPAASNAEEA